MLAYAANAPRHAERRSSPNAMLIVIAAHVAAIAVLMSAKMDLPPRIFDPPTTVIDVPLPTTPPPPEPVRHPMPPQPGPTMTPQPTPVAPPADPVVTADPVRIDPGVLTGGGTASVPVLPPPRLDPVKLGPQLLTPASELKPPYPHDKLLSEEEALLKLRLTIDERGRVTAVDPIGRADPVFLKAARQYLLAHWRYRPASEDGRSVTSSTVVTLHFTLEG
jgi:periplasmic protein TonB